MRMLRQCLNIVPSCPRACTAALPTRSSNCTLRKAFKSYATQLYSKKRGNRWLARDVSSSESSSASGDATPLNENHSQRGTQLTEAAPLVDALLQLLDKDGANDELSEDSKQQVDDYIEKLEGVGAGQNPLESELLWGNYNVSYVSMGNKQYGQPAGGRFRTGLGKFLFKTNALCQSIIRPDIVTNKINISLFGFIPLSVGLRGKLVPELSEASTVKVCFEPPVLSLPGGIHTRIGPPSSVILTTTYLDENVRLGKGSRGSKFVFSRGGNADVNNMELVGLEKTSTLGIGIVVSLLGLLVVGGGWIMSSSTIPIPFRAAGLMAMLLGAALSGVFYRGGIIDGRAEATPDQITNQSVA